MRCVFQRQRPAQQNSPFRIQQVPLPGVELLNGSPVMWLSVENYHMYSLQSDL